MKSLMQINEGFLPKDEKSLILHLLQLNKIPAEILSLDSRTLDPGQIFLPLIGENFDGHDHIEEAFNKGAIACLSQIDPLKLNSREAFKDKIIQVSSTLGFLHNLANAYRNKINPLVIAITGSSGKTTVKDLVQLVLASALRVYATQANHNNEIGLPKTILSMPEDTQVLVLEMGMRGLGQIRLLSQIAEPNVALITNVGTAHLELLGSQVNIKKAKMEIIDALKNYDGNQIKNKPRKILIIDEFLYSELAAANFLDPNTGSKIDAEIFYFDYAQIAGLNSIDQILLSRGIRADFNAVIKLATMLGLDRQVIIETLKKYRPGRGRGAFLYDAKNNIYIDETYNSNTEALKNSVDALFEQFPQEMKIAVIGDIKEVSKTTVDKCFTEIKSLANDKFIVIDLRGLDLDESYQLVKKTIDCIPGRKVLLFKASRAIALDKLLDRFNLRSI